MRTRRNLVIGMAATTLALTACGIAAGSPGGTPGGHPAPVSARHAPDNDQEWLARVKRHAAPPAGDAGIGRPQADASSFMHQDDPAHLGQAEIG